MKILAYITIFVIFWFWLLDYPYAKDAKTLNMKSETGEVVLTSEPCPFIKNGLQGYPFYAYATDKGKPNHEGCWKMDIVDRFEAILIYFPEIDATAVYNPKLFQPKADM